MATSKLSQYIKIQDVIREEIINNKTEGLQYTISNLAERFGVNRLTIRHALDGLIQEGLVQSIKGVGIFPNQNHQIIENIDEPSNYIYEFNQEGHEAKIETLRFEWTKADMEVSRNLLIKPGTKILFVKRLRSVDNIPLTLDYRYVRLPWASVLTKDKLQNGHIRRIIESEKGIQWHGMSNQIRAMSADQEISAILHISAGDPIVVRNIVLYSKEPNIAIIYSISYYCADKFRWKSYIEFK